MPRSSPSLMCCSLQHLKILQSFVSQVEPLVSFAMDLLLSGTCQCVLLPPFEDELLRWTEGRKDRSSSDTVFLSLCETFSESECHIFPQPFIEGDTSSIVLRQTVSVIYRNTNKLLVFLLLLSHTLQNLPIAVKVVYDTELH